MFIWWNILNECFIVLVYYHKLQHKYEESEAEGEYKDKDPEEDPIDCANAHKLVIKLILKSSLRALKGSKRDMVFSTCYIIESMHMRWGFG